MKSFFTAIFASLLFLIHFSLSAQTQHHRVRIYLDGKSLSDIEKTGVAADHGYYKKNTWIDTEVSTEELQKLNEAQFRLEILRQTENHKSALFYPCPVRGDVAYQDPSMFELGSMAGYFTYQEMLDILDTMAARFPNIISVKKIINDTILTHQSRPIYYVVISDNPNNEQEDEPQILFNALHHAREPGSLSQLIYFMYYLLQNYENDSKIQYFVNNTAIYFVPCINPDGYLFNQQQSPSGGGLWRKNRRSNSDGTMGVDLNRNYGYEWGFDNNGSDTIGLSDVYRGTAPFSEPETRAIKYLCENHQFEIALNNHTFGNLLIYPWGYQQNLYSPDSANFVNIAQHLTRFNQYNYGTANQTVGYVVNGSSDDWMYGEQQTKPKIFAMTPEAGSFVFQFWPPQEEILPFCREMLKMNISALEVLTNLAVASSVSPTIISENDYAKYAFKQLGLNPTGDYTVSIEPLSTNLLAPTEQRIYSTFAFNQTWIDSIPLTLTGNVLQGDEIKYVIKAENGGILYTDTVTRFFGNENILFYSNADAINGFTSNNWNTTTMQFYSAPSSITDSPFGNYPNNVQNEILLNEPINLSGCYYAELSFFAKWQIETRYDYVQCLASADDGITWIPLCGKFTKPGTFDQDFEQPIYDGFQNNWIKEKINLSSFIGNTIRIKFILKSDGFESYDGFYFDELKVTTIPDSLSTVVEAKKESLITIFPNPAKNQIVLSNVFGKGIRISIMDLQGKVILSENVFSNYPVLDISSLNQGNYIVLTEKDSERQYHKLVIIK